MVFVLEKCKKQVKKPLEKCNFFVGLKKFCIFAPYSILGWIRYNCNKNR